MNSGLKSAYTIHENHTLRNRQAVRRLNSRPFLIRKLQLVADLLVWTILQKSEWTLIPILNFPGIDSDSEFTEDRSHFPSCSRFLPFLEDLGAALPTSRPGRYPR